MPLLVNIDVPDLDAAVAFYTRAFDLRVDRRFDGFVELASERVHIYLLHKPPGTPPFAGATSGRDYARHWTPVHLDLEVDDVPTAVARACDAGATLEGEIRTSAWGTIAQLRDPFGHGLCVLAFSGRGYDALLPEPEADRRSLLVVGHAPSANTRAMRDALMRGAAHPEATSVRARYVSAALARAEDVLGADAIALLTTENLGYMSGALKDFFDRTYERCLEATVGKPFAVIIRAKHDGTGTERGIASITTGLRWRAVEAPLLCHGPYDPAFLERCEELGAKLAVGLDAGLL